MRETKTYKDRLKTYISEDEIYKKYKKGETNFNDFDKFCIQHCIDIEEILQDNQILRIKASARETEYYKLKEVINKAIEYIKERFYFNEETGEYALLHTFDKCNVKELLDILNEVSK